MLIGTTLWFLGLLMVIIYSLIPYLICIILLLYILHSNIQPLCHTPEQIFYLDIAGNNKARTAIRFFMKLLNVS